MPILYEGFKIRFRRSFAVALMNTSPEVRALDISFEDVFRDLVRIALSASSLDFVLIRSFKHKEWREAAYTVYDLWERDEKGGWGKSLGVVSGGIREVFVASRQTKVWKLVPNSQQLIKRGRHPRPHLG